jgi:hypothetical protein
MAASHSVWTIVLRGRPARRGIAAAVTTSLLFALAGCDGAPTRPVDTTGTSPPAAVSHERPSPPAAPETVSAAAASQVQAIREFASAYINWTADDVAQRMRTLAAASVGQARSAMQLAAAQVAGDYELQQGGISNSGTVEAIAPLAGRQGVYVVVTHEATAAINTTQYQGLRPAWHVAVAQVTELSPGRWAVSRWQPEN